MPRRPTQPVRSDTQGQHSLLKAKPILKWAGGKGRLLPQYEPLFPERIGTFFEPFLGSAAVFFHLWNKGRVPKAVLYDLNKHLIATYRAVKNQPEMVIERLRRHAKAHCRQYYYEVVRPANPKGLVDQAARVIYLNKTCFNGLWRVNSKGQFNVPMGSYKNPRICNAEAIRAASEALQHARLKPGPYEAVLVDAQASDFVYLDPPYHPISDTSRFTSYTARDFGREQQQALAQHFCSLDEKGCLVMLSNSDCN